MRHAHSLRWAGLVAAAVFVVGCSDQTAVETSQLTIMTTSRALDEATSMAVAEYLKAQGVDVEIQQHSALSEAYGALNAPTAQDQAVLGILTAPQDQQAEERTVQLPEDLEIVAQAPAEIGFVATASSITAAKFARQVVETDDPEMPMGEACAEQTWFHPQLDEESLEIIGDALAQQGCEPTFETVETLDAETSTELIEQLTMEPNTVVMLRGVNPAISDQGLASLDIETRQWPHSNIVAVSHIDADNPLAAEVGEVLDVLNSDAATTLMRGYYNAQTSVSDLQYEVDDAVRYWLAEADLIDPDTVINITDDND
ncbi:hypothetical protein [Enteractinococcus coprophilus]|uniref:ABC transporter substrate-binding protein n=1 Tax=Enteractinococcus coprophilus TaxID=1027633 RepID=A0A543A0E7_9MICC|nr:hypothetical protein [Enteractinococcus coprophilus]TQL66058.1 hypothetical protein FB556_2537 [Enteractinococcus coprophilus]